MNPIGLTADRVLPCSAPSLPAATRTITLGTSAEAMSHRLCILAFLSLALSATAQIPAIPEPPMIFYGTIRTSAGSQTTPASVQWQVVSSTGATSSGSATIVALEGTAYYVATVPVETRQLADGTSLSASAGKLDQTAATVTLTPSFTADGRAARLADGSAQFSYSAAQMGMVERVDLTLGETYSEWSQRIFGSLADPNGDFDRDGSTNQQEYLAGTDPKNPSSRFMPAGFSVAPDGTFTISWPSIADRFYTLERRVDLSSGQWQSVTSSIPGTGSTLSRTDTPPVGSKRVFYRITVTQ